MGRTLNATKTRDGLLSLFAKTTPYASTNPLLSSYVTQGDQADQATSEIGSSTA
jgi:hypothetical protein